jgi:protein TonB
MFEDSLLDSNGLGKTKKPATFAISFLLQSTVLALVAAIPLIYAEPLPARVLMTFLIAPPSPPPPPAPPAEVRPVRVIVKARPQPAVMTEPTAIPSHVATVIDPPTPPGLFTGVVSVPGGTGDPEAKNFFVNLITTPPPPPPPPPQPPAQQDPVRVSTGVAAAKLISQAQPAYPPLARQARIQGTVRLEAVISRDGAIENLTVISGHPLLIPAALEAVRQWRYRPTLLNGAPVEVITTVDVDFTLGG